MAKTVKTGLSMGVCIMLVLPSFGEDRSLDQLIESVRENERLYQNIEVVWTRKYELVAAAKDTLEGDVQLIEEECRSVAQGELFYMNQSGTMLSKGQPPHSTDLVAGHDGHLTRVFAQQAAGNIIAARKDFSEFLRPHTIMLRRYWVKFPLSVLLQGHEAIRANKPACNRGPLDNYYFDVRLAGNGRCKGVACQKVAIDLSPNDGGQRRDIVSRLVLWLAPTRNFLPLKIENFGLNLSDSVPFEIGIVKECREIAAGTWFPFETVFEGYSDRLFILKGKWVLSNRETTKVQNVVLGPHYGIELFRDIEIPDGIPVYEIAADGEIVREYVKGAPHSEERGWMRYLMVVVLSVIAVAIVISLRWFYRLTPREV